MVSSEAGYRSMIDVMFVAELEASRWAQQVK
jgi:hypothetical protein